AEYEKAADYDRQRCRHVHRHGRSSLVLRRTLGQAAGNDVPYFAVGLVSVVRGQGRLQQAQPRGRVAHPDVDEAQRSRGRIVHATGHAVAQHVVRVAEGDHVDRLGTGLATLEPALLQRLAEAADADRLQRRVLSGLRWRVVFVAEAQQRYLIGEHEEARPVVE